MLDQLLESKNNNEENARKGGFLITTLGVLAAVLLTGWTYSLFAKNYGLGAGDFDLSSLVTPIAVSEEQPPKPEIKIEKSQKTSGNKIILKEFYDDISNATNPTKDLRGEKDVVPVGLIDPDNVVRGNFNQIPDDVGRNTDPNDSRCGLCPPDDSRTTVDDKIPEVVVRTTPTPKPPLRSLGVINGIATYLAKPPYSAAAKQMRVEGSVNVQVLIDEQGNVMSASAVSGHPLLRVGSENAARQSKFSPTLLSNQPVKVTGIIVYRFSL